MPNSSHYFHEQMSLDTQTRHAMTAVLLMMGPVVTPKVFKDNSNIKRYTSDCFMSAALELENLNLGKLLSLQISGPVSHIFVKYPPEQVEPILSSNPNLYCSAEQYTARYNQSISKGITKLQVKKLQELGIIPEEFLVR